MIGQSGIIGNQDYWITGSRVYFQPDPLELTYGVFTPQPIFDFGTVEVVSPSVAPTVAKLFDSDGGIRRLVAQQVTMIEEKYSVKCHNFSPEMLAVLFSANPATSFAQAATPIVSTQFAIPGRMVKLVDTNGVLVYGVASITTVVLTSGSVAMVRGTDWDVVSLERGLIKVYGTSAVLAAPGNITVTYVPRVIAATTAGQQARLINPQTMGIVNGTGLIIWGRGNNMFQSVREARFSLTPGAGALSDQNYSEHTIEMSVLNDLTAAVPAGRLLYWLGDTIPTVPGD